MPNSLHIPREILDALLTDARAHAPNESCGLLSGSNSTITNFHPAQNASPTPKTNYEIAPRTLFEFMRELRKNNLELVAIYHSHPTTENKPSPTDIARAYYPEVTYIIVDPRPNAANPIRAFQIHEEKATELPIEAFSNEERP